MIEKTQPKLGKTRNHYNEESMRYGEVSGEYPKLPVILISAHREDQIRRRALDEGAVDFLYKPFDGEELLRSINRAIENTPRS